MPIDGVQLAHLIESQAASLRMWIGSRCISPEDAVQEAFCKLAMQEPVPANPVAWLYRVSRNVAAKQRRTDVRRRRREEKWAPSEVAQAAYTDPCDIADAVAAVEALEPELREVVVARLWGQLSLEVVAGLCNISTATAYRRYQAAMALLRAKLTSQSEKPR